MSLNEASLKSMGKMVQAMLPYENPFEPKHNLSKCILEIYKATVSFNPKLQEHEGLMYYILKGVDNMDKDTTKNFERYLIHVRNIIENHYPWENNV